MLGRFAPLAVDLRPHDIQLVPVASGEFLQWKSQKPSNLAVGSSCPRQGLHALS